MFKKSNLITMTTFQADGSDPIITSTKSIFVMTYIFCHALKHCSNYFKTGEDISFDPII
jgi:hypothetical protein